MSIKIKFPHDELCRRTAIILGVHRSDIISVYPTEGGKKFFVTYWSRGKYPWGNTKQNTTATIWQIMDALPLTDISGSVEKIWSKGIQSILEVLGLKAMPQSEKELKRAYYRAAKQVHPDMGGSEEAFRTVNAAYGSVLVMLPNLRRGVV